MLGGILKYFDKLGEFYVDLLAKVFRYLKLTDAQEPRQIESPHSKKKTEDDRVKRFELAFDEAKRLSEQGIEEAKDKELIRSWWAQIGKQGYTEKTHWCTLGVHIPLINAGLLEVEDLPRDIALARGYLNTTPKGFKVVPPEDIVVGDIFIKWRGKTVHGGGKNSWMGHIGWFDGYTDDGKSFYSVGANQDGKFNRKCFKTFKLLGGIRVIGGSVDTIEEDGGVDMSIDKSFIPQRFQQRALDAAQQFLLAKETRNKNDIRWAFNKIKQSEQVYKGIESDTGIPWQAVASIHYLESSVRFDRHIHNGDPLTGRTVRIPKGRPTAAPKNGNEYTFAESVKDALTVLKKRPNSWSLPNLMYYLESYNGMGYYFRGLNSPYLTAGTQFQQSGKFVADGKFDPEASSRRAGAMILMKRLGYEPL